MSCEACGAAVRADATFCEQCGARLAAPPQPATATRHGLAGSGLIVVIAAAMTGLAIIVGMVVLVRALLA